MTIRQLEYFYSVSQILSFSEAAKKNYVSQPSISKSIMLLEEELGTQLFKRSRHTVELTEAGRVLADGLPELQIHLDQLVNATKAAGDGLAEKIRLRVLDGNHLPESVRQAMQTLDRKENRPDISIAKVECGEETKLLENGDTDFVVTFDFELLDSGEELETIAVEHVHSCIALPSSHPLAECGSLSLSELAQETFIAVGGPTAPGTAVMLKQLEENSCPARVRFVPDVHTLFLLIEAGAGVSIVNSGFYISSELAIKCVECPQLSDRNVVLAWKRRPYRDVLERFIGEVRTALSLSELRNGAR